MDWSDWRNEFPILSHKTYLNSCSLGPISIRVREALREYMETWEMQSIPWDETSWDIWLEKVNEARSSFARLINAHPDEIAVTYAASTAISSIAGALDFNERNEAVVTELDFPTNFYIWKSHEKIGAKVKMIKSRDGISISADDYEKVVTERTRIVSTSHVFSFSGYMQNLEEIAEICRKNDVIFLVDAYQSAGTIPIDVRKMDVDILVSGTVKWLLGGPGIAFMYVRRDIIENFEPMCTGWLASENPFEFSPDRFVYAPDARRFQQGSPSVPCAYSAKAGIDIILEADPERIRKRTVELTQMVIDMAEENHIGTRTPEDPEERGSIVILTPENSRKIFEKLIAEGIVTSYRKGIRVSPHFFNNEDDIDRLFRVMTGG